MIGFCYRIEEGLVQLRGDVPRLTLHSVRGVQRWQAETGFPVMKRRLGSAVNGRSYVSQCHELMLFVLTYNLMLN